LAISAPFSEGLGRVGPRYDVEICIVTL
jgi:hypothetical protein